MRLKRVLRGRYQRGFTLVELVVAAALVLLGMVFASSLLLRSQIVTNRLVASFRDPQPRLATVRLRRDLESGQIRSAWLPGWRSEPLVVRSNEGVLVSWYEDGGVLRRKQLRGPDEEVDQQVMRDVESWRWRRVGPDVVDVELRFRTRDASGAVLLDVRRSWRARAVLKTESLRVAARGRGGW